MLSPKNKASVSTRPAEIPNMEDEETLLFNDIVKSAKSLDSTKMSSLIDIVGKITPQSSKEIVGKTSILVNTSRVTVSEYRSNNNFHIGNSVRKNSDSSAHESPHRKKIRLDTSNVYQLSKLQADSQNIREVTCVEKPQAIDKGYQVPLKALLSEKSVAELPIPRNNIRGSIDETSNVPTFRNSPQQNLSLCSRKKKISSTNLSKMGQRTVMGTNLNMSTDSLDEIQCDLLGFYSNSSKSKPSPDVNAQNETLVQGNLESDPTPLWKAASSTSVHNNKHLDEISKLKKLQEPSKVEFSKQKSSPVLKSRSPSSGSGQFVPCRESGMSQAVNLQDKNKYEVQKSFHKVAGSMAIPVKSLARSQFVLSPGKTNTSQKLKAAAYVKQDISETSIISGKGETSNKGRSIKTEIQTSSHVSTDYRQNATSPSSKNNTMRSDIHISSPSTSSCHSFNKGNLNFKSSEKAVLELQNPKLSYNLSQNPNKFFPCGKINAFDVLMGRQKISEKKSPSKRLGKNSPIKYMLKNKSPKNLKYKTVSPSKSSFVRKLDFEETGGGPSKEPEAENSAYVPYFKEFVGHFEYILNSVSNDKEMSLVIQNEYKNHITAFKNLEDIVSKKLYIRMLGRKYTWHRVSQIKYKDIAPDAVKKAFSDLEETDFVTSDNSEENIEVLLQLLNKSELQSLCKTFHIQPATGPKQMLINALLNYGHQQSVIGSQKRNSSSLLVMRSRECLGHCIKLCEEKRQSFLSIILLFSLPHQDIDEDREVSKQLLLLHYVKNGTVQFPAFVIKKTIPIFSTVEEFSCFQEANELLNDLTTALNKKDWSYAQKCGEQASAEFDKILQNSALSSRASELPLFLRRFSGGSTYAYIMYRAVEACKKKKECVQFGVYMLKKLLSQNIYLPQYRGNWYEQLALLQQVHCKEYLQAAGTVVEAMFDSDVSEVQKHIISSRGSLLLRSKKLNSELKLNLTECMLYPLIYPPSISIKARALQSTAPGYKKIYIQQQQQLEEITYSSVEEYAIHHYRTQGYTRGVHDEGGIINALFGLIFWDIIYDYPVPDVFRNHFQREPLDLCSGEFYKNRRKVIDGRLEELCNWSMDQARDFILNVLRGHENEESVVRWQRFQGIDEIMGLIECIKMDILSKILDRVVKNYRSVRKGFPDLTVWNPVKKECKFVEVKGPSDRLSIPQHLWLNYLTECSSQCAEVCYVQTTGSKAVKSKRSDSN